MKKRAIFILCTVIISFSCGYFRGYRQPAVSGDAYEFQQFNKETKFPYIATNERSAYIREHYEGVKIGMDGNEVLEVMGKPDEVDALHFVGGPPRAWFWGYFINKEYERAPDDSDNSVEIFFDTSGKVKKIAVKLDAPPRPTPLPANMQIKVANVNGR